MKSFKNVLVLYCYTVLVLYSMLDTHTDTDGVVRLYSAFIWFVSLQAWGYGPNVAVPLEIVGAVSNIQANSSKSQKKGESKWWLLVAQPHPQAYRASSHA